MQLLRLVGNFFGVRKGTRIQARARVGTESWAKDFASCFPAFLIQDSGLALGW
jgi:hypothetical protein